MTGFASDLERHPAGRQARTVLGRTKVIVNDFGLQALAVYRFGRALLRAGARPRAWLLLPLGWILYAIGRIYCKRGLGIQLDLDADIGPGLYIGHFGGIRVSKCRIGANCSIAQSSRIGPDSSGTGPVIGDRVWIGAHAHIIGPIRIGSGATISAAAYLTRDIPENALCMGKPARVVMRDYDNSLILNLPAASKS